MKKPGEQKTKGRGAKENAATSSPAPATASGPVSKDKITSFRDKTAAKKKKKR